MNRAAYRRSAQWVTIAGGGAIAALYLPRWFVVVVVLLLTGLAWINEWTRLAGKELVEAQQRHVDATRHYADACLRSAELSDEYVRAIRAYLSIPDTDTTPNAWRRDLKAVPDA